MPIEPLLAEWRLRRSLLLRNLLMQWSALVKVSILAAEASRMADKTPSFGASAAIAARYRFVEPHELRAVLEQACRDAGTNDPGSIRTMERNRVFHANLVEYRRMRAQHFTPSSHRDAIGDAAAAFMAAQAFALLLGLESLAEGKPSTAPLVATIMRRGADGLYRLGRTQFDALAQIAVDLRAWLLATKRTHVVLIEAPLGNSVPVAVLAKVFQAGGITVDIVEWGCPRNDRALAGRTVTNSARDLASIPLVADAPFLLFIDDAITGSRFLKMATALRKAIGGERLGAIALRVRFDPATKAKVGQLRSLDAIKKWAKELGMPIGEEVLPDLPLFKLDAGPSGYLSTALAWGDAGHAAGKRKTNILFYFIDRFEAITRELGVSGHSEARQILHHKIWRKDISGTLHLIPDYIGDPVQQQIVGSLPGDFFDGIRQAARDAFPHDYVGRAIHGEIELRRRSDWLKTCISTAALPLMQPNHAHFLNNAVTSLSEAGYVAGVPAPPRDHDYGLYTIPMPPGEDALHLQLVNRIVTSAASLKPRP